MLAAVSYLVTGSLKLATSIAAIDWILKTIMYFIHELIWDRIPFGRESIESDDV